MWYGTIAQGVWCLPVENLNSEAYHDFMQKTKEHIVQPSFHQRSDVYYQVVVHLVLRDGATLISNAQVINQIDVLNQDFAGRGANLYKLQNEFESLITDTGIRFCLSTTDPEGNPTNGITSTITNSANIALLVGQNGRRAIHFDQLGGKTPWDPSRYINIWVGEYGDFLGSAFFPGMAPFPEEAGIVIDPRSFGSLGDAAVHPFYHGGHTLTHEMGHYFGLIHIWGGPSEHDCNDSDAVDDTPNQEGPYFGCPSGVQQSCGVHNMYQNFMDLTDDRCLAAFTKDQSLRMHAVIDAFYPDMGIEVPCHEVVMPFQNWYEGLVWAADQRSAQFVLYNPEGFAEKIFLDVFSVDGRLVQHDTWEGSQTYRLNLNEHASGIYFVRISDGQHDMIRKIISYQ